MTATSTLFVPDCVRAARALVADGDWPKDIVSPSLHKVLDALYSCGERWVESTLSTERDPSPVLFSDIVGGHLLQQSVASGHDVGLRLRAIVYAISEALEVAHRIAGGFTDHGDVLNFENPNLHNGFLKVVFVELAHLVAEFDELTGGGGR